jgi:hypothetical protein
MPLVKLPDGTTAIVCTRGHRQSCYVCGAPAPLLCDYPVTSSKSGTCDRPFCRRHGTNQSPDVDYCLAHENHRQKVADEQQRLKAGE